MLAILTAISSTHQAFTVEATIKATTTIKVITATVQVTGTQDTEMLRPAILEKKDTPY